MGEVIAFPVKKYEESVLDDTVKISFDGENFTWSDKLPDKLPLEMFFELSPTPIVTIEDIPERITNEVTTEVIDFWAEQLISFIEYDTEMMFKGEPVALNGPLTAELLSDIKITMYNFFNRNS